MNLRLLGQVSLLLVAVSLCGCSSNNKGKIEGTRWSSQATKVGANDLPAGAMTLEFEASGKFKMKSGLETFTGTYTLGMMDYVILNMDKEMLGRKQHTQRIEISDTALKLIDSDGTTVPFTKVN